MNPIRPVRPLFLLMVVVMALFLTGCNVAVKPSDSQTLDRQASVAEAMAAKAKTDPACPQVYKDFLELNAASWRNVADFGAGRKPSVE